MPDLVSACIDDLKNKIAELPEFYSGEKTAILYDADDFLDESKDLNPPLAAVIYEGATPQSEQTGGIAAQIMYGIYIISDREYGGVLSAYDLLYRIRKTIVDTRSPSEHRWIYKGEFPLDIGTGLGYVQRWITNAILTT